MNILSKLKNLIVGTPKVHIIYRPLASAEETYEGSNFYTVEVTGPLYTKGRKSGFVGKVDQRGGEVRAFRFDRIKAIASV